MPGGRRPQNTRAKLQRDWMTAHRTGSIPVCYSARSYPRTRTRPLEKQAISLLSLPADGMAVVRCFQRKRGPEGRFVAKTGPEQANPSTAFRNAKTPRTAPQTPGKAQKRPRLRALHNVERSFHQTTLVEGMLLSSKLLSIGRLPEFAAGNVSLGNVDFGTIPSSRRSHGDPISVLPRRLFCARNRPNSCVVRFSDVENSNTRTGADSRLRRGTST